MTSVVVDGTTYCDDWTCPNTMLGRGYATHFFPMVGKVLGRVEDAEDAATAAAASAVLAAEYTEALSATSTTSLTVGAGTQSLTIEADKQFVAGSKVIVARTSAPTTTWMYGEVTSYSGTTLAVNVSDYLGSGTHADWTISLSGIKGASGTSGASLTRVTKTTTASLGASDNAKYVEMTGTWTLSFSDCATLASGWWCVLVNAGTGLITVDPNSTEQIDGVTSFVMYPGESRLVVCSGSALYSTVMRPFAYTFTASGTFTKPPGYTYFGGLLWGAGGSGMKKSGGASGGGGGACVPFTLAASAVGTTETITIGSGGTGPSTDATDGAAGGNSSIGSLVTAYGGGAPANAQSAYGGGGGGAMSAGASVSGGEPRVVTNSAQDGLGGASCEVGNANHSGWGGASGGPAATSLTGGSSIYGGAGGGGAGASSGGTSVFGGAGGAGGSTSSGTAGTAPGGGGGGTLTGTKAGDGARGELRIWGIV